MESGGVYRAEFDAWLALPVSLILVACTVWIMWAVMRKRPLPITPALVATLLMGWVVWKYL